MKKTIVLAMALLFTACSSGESVEEYNKRQAELLESKRPKSKVVKVETALPGGTKVACDGLMSAEKVSELLGEKDPVTISDVTKGEMDATSVCSVRRGGKIMDQKTQEELVKKKANLGVLAGDEICSIAMYCSIPADEEQFKEDCKKEVEKGGAKSNEAVGVFACIKVTPKGANDAYTYRFIDPDSRCVLRVRGGPSVNDEAAVQTCAKAALEVVTPESIKPDEAGEGEGEGGGEAATE